MNGNSIPPVGNNNRRRAKINMKTPVKKINKSHSSSAPAGRVKAAKPRSAVKPLISETRQRSGYPISYIVWASLLAISIIWLLVAIKSENTPAPSRVPVNQFRANAANQACNNDPLVTIPDCSKLKAQ